MKVNKFKMAVVVAFTSMFLMTSSISFAYSDSVEKKIERLEKDIEKQQEKLDKESNKRNKRNNRSSYSGSSSTSSSSDRKREKIQDKITDIRKEIDDIKKKEDDKIDKRVKSIDAQKQQSENKVRNLQSAREKKIAAEKKRYENLLEKEKKTNPSYVAPAFSVDTSSNDRLIAEEQKKIKALQDQINDIKSPKRKLR